MGNTKDALKNLQAKYNVSVPTSVNNSVQPQVKTPAASGYLETTKSSTQKALENLAEKYTPSSATGALNNTAKQNIQQPVQKSKSQESLDNLFKKYNGNAQNDSKIAQNVEKLNINTQIVNNSAVDKLAKKYGVASGNAPALSVRPEKYTIDNIDNYMDRAEYLAGKTAWTEEEKQEAKELLAIMDEPTLFTDPKGLIDAWKFNLGGDASNASWKQRQMSAAKISGNPDDYKKGQKNLETWANLYNKYHNKQYALVKGFADATGITSLGKLAATGTQKAVDKISGTDTAEKFKTDIADWEKQSGEIANMNIGGKVANIAGNVAGSMALFSFIGKGLASVKGFKELPTIAKGIVSGAGAMGGSTAITEAGDVATGEKTVGEYAADIAVSAGSGAAGGALGGLIGNNGTKLLQKYGLQNNRAAYTVVGGLQGLGLAGGREGVEVIARELGYKKGEKLTAEQIAQDLLVSSLFGAFQYYTNFQTASAPAKTPYKSKYFDGMTAQEAQAERRRLAMIYHSDLGGDEAVMKEINADYDEYLKTIVNKASEAYSKATKAAASGKTDEATSAMQVYRQNVENAMILVQDNENYSNEVVDTFAALKAVGDSGVIVSEGDVLTLGEKPAVEEPAIDEKSLQQVEAAKAEIERRQTPAQGNAKDIQNAIIQENNPRDESLSSHTWINNAEDIKTFEEAVNEYGIEDYAPDFKANDIENALKDGKITVYSSYPIEKGVFVTASRMEAQDYAGGGQVYSKDVSLNDVAWIEVGQGQYAPVESDIPKLKTAEEIITYAESKGYELKRASDLETTQQEEPKYLPTAEEIAAEVPKKNIVSDEEIEDFLRTPLDPEVDENVDYHLPTVEDLERQAEAAERKRMKNEKSGMPTRSKAELRKEITALFSLPQKGRSKIYQLIDDAAADMIGAGRITEAQRQELLERLFEAGALDTTVDDTRQAMAAELKGRKIFVSEKAKAEFGDDWGNFYRQARAAGIQLVNDSNKRGVDSVIQGFDMDYPGMVSDVVDADVKAQLEFVVDLAGEYKPTHTFEDEAYDLSKQFGEEAGKEYLENIERRFDFALEKFADKAGLEIDLRTELNDKVAAEKEKWRTSAEKKAERTKLAQQNKQTLRDIQRLRKRTGYNDIKVKDALEALSPEDRVIAENAINHIATNAQRLTEKAKAKRDAALERYDELSASDPNYIPDKQTLDWLANKDAEYFSSKSLEELQDIHRVITAMNKHIEDLNTEIGEGRTEEFETLYNKSKQEIQNSKGRAEKAGAAGRLQKFFNEEQMTAMNIIEMISGWDPDSTFYKHVGKQLEQAEFDSQRIKVEAERLVEPFRKKYKEWITKSDGQGKDAIWYELEVPEFLEYGAGNKPLFGRTFKVYLTPAMKVELARGIRNFDNLRHAEGGVTFPNKELYSKGNRKEAYAQGSRTVRMAPETMKALFSYKSLTPEEKELYKVMDDVFNIWARDHINATSQIEDGVDRALSNVYSKIYTNENFRKTDLTIKQAIGDIGSLQGRVFSKKPMLAMSVWDAFDDTVDTVSKYSGYGIPVRNIDMLLNWNEGGGVNNSMKEVIAQKWGGNIRDFLTSKSNGLIAQLSNKYTENDTIGGVLNSLLSNYVSGVFGANPGIVLKQFTSLPTFGAVLGFDTFPSPKQMANIDTEEIWQNTPILEYRSLGWNDAAIAQLKNNPTWMQKNKVTRFITEGGITAMDRFTVKLAWPWAENYVKKHYPDVEVGSDKFKKLQTEIYQDAVTLTQPMYDEMHRAQIMKNPKATTKPFTMFKTVPMQQQNTLRKMFGEWQNAKGTEAKKKASKNLRVAIVSILAAGAGYEGVEYLNQLWKNKAKNYRNEKGELTTGSVVSEISKSMVEDLAGMFVFADEMIELAGRIGGENSFYNAIETPGIEQLNDILDGAEDLGKTVKSTMEDIRNIQQNNGDVSQYISENAEVLFGAVKDAAYMASHYLAGVPISNIEKYILGTIDWIDEGVAEQYKMLWDKTNKTDLKGLTGKKLYSRLSECIDNRVDGVKDSTKEELARLYEAVGVEVIPSDTPGTLTVDGEKVKLDAAMKQAYNNAYKNFVENSLNELIASEHYKDFDDINKAKSISKLYGFAKSAGEAAIGKDITKTAESYQSALDAGIKSSDYLYFQTILGDLHSDKDKHGKTKKVKALELIDSMDLTYEQKDYMYYAAGYSESNIDSDAPWHKQLGKLPAPGLNEMELEEPKYLEAP